MVGVYVHLGKYRDAEFSVRKSAHDDYTLKITLKPDGGDVTIFMSGEQLDELFEVVAEA